MTLLEKYGGTINEMLADVELAINEAKNDLADKKRERRKLENQLIEMEARREENYQKFFAVAKDFIKVLFKDFLKRKSTRETFQRIIHPVNEYIKYSDWADETREQLKAATDAENDAEERLNSILILYDKIKSIG